MRTVTRINDGWDFTLEGKTSRVELPHTWNALDGQGAAETYLRTSAVYSRQLDACDSATFIECRGVNSKAKVCANGVTVGTHSGGYSAFRFDITEFIKDGCKIEIIADNTADDYTYPAYADFTFYGGIYRDVNLIQTGVSRFSMKDYGSDGVYATPVKTADGWELRIKALTENAEGCLIRYTLFDASSEPRAVCECEAKDVCSAKMTVENVTLWSGRSNPYLYTLRCELICDGEVSDNLDIPVGFREYRIDSERGFFLNGEQIKLKGVSRHQDREALGNALTEKEHAEDVSMIMDVGANSIRLAHYQQNSFFYDLCDQNGLLVWAEVPVISRFSLSRQENARQQLVELIKQNYNHPSIFCWGIQNEITIGSVSGGKLEKALRELNSLAKHLDNSRYTTCAQLSMCSENSELNSITDILGYNHYFGWYMDSVDGIGKWFDTWRNACPEKKLCLSEYGAEGITRYHSDSPAQGDYSEDYQAIFHERYIEEINAREWLWGSYVWNMFDFGSAARNEGGVRGRNNKGLVSFDRKIKKDSFYLYKAYWSDEPFVHITGERYKDRPCGVKQIKVYSNCPQVTLEYAGESVTKTGEHVFVFDGVQLNFGELVLTARAADCSHSITVCGVESLPDEYVMDESEGSFVRNWFVPEGESSERLSLDSRLGDILKSDEVRSLVTRFAGEKAGKIAALPLLKPLYPVKVRPVMKLAVRFGLDAHYTELVDGFLHTLKK